MPQSIQIVSAPYAVSSKTDTVNFSATFAPAVRPSRRGGRPRPTASTIQTLGSGGGLSVSTSGGGTSIGVNVGLNISSKGISVTGAPSLSSLTSPQAVQSIAFAAAQKAGLNLNMSPAQAINTLAPGALNSISGAVSGQISQAISGLGFETIRFPGMGQISIVIGAGPKWLAEQIMKYKTIVPPFVPGLKINMAMVSAALSIIRAAASGNLGKIASSIMEDLLEDIKEQSGLADLQDQVKDQLAEVQGAINTVQNIQKNGINIGLNASLDIINNAESNYVDQYNKENPPQTTIDPDGNTIVTEASPPDTSLYSKLKSGLSEINPTTPEPTPTAMA